MPPQEPTRHLIVSCVTRGLSHRQFTMLLGRDRLRARRALAERLEAEGKPLWEILCGDTPGGWGRVRPATAGLTTSLPHRVTCEACRRLLDVQRATFSLRPDTADRKKLHAVSHWHIAYGPFLYCGAEWASGSGQRWTFDLSQVTCEACLRKRELELVPHALEGLS